MIEGISRAIYRGAQKIDFFGTRFLSKGSLGDRALNKLTGFENKTGRLVWLTQKDPAFDKYARECATRGMNDLGVQLWHYMRDFGGEMTKEALIPGDATRFNDLFAALEKQAEWIVMYGEHCLYKGDDVKAATRLVKLTKRQMEEIIPDYNLSRGWGRGAQEVRMQWVNPFNPSRQ